MMTLLRSLERHQRSLRNRIALWPGLPGAPDILDPERFAGRRVIVIGPAETLADDLEGTVVDGFDVVVRLNNGLSLADTRPDLFGRRTDILVHNLRETGPRNAGEIPASLLTDKGVSMLVYPHWRRSADRRAYRAKRTALKRAGGPPLSILPPEIMREIRADLGNRAPTVGISAILFFLATPASELAIHGFTFFETRYASGYNDAIRSGAEARAWVDARGAHEPLSEKRLLRKRLALPHAPRVILGRNVRRHLEAD